jgi:hypothetical protein
MPERLAELGIAVPDQIPLVEKEPINWVGPASRHLDHPPRVRIPRDAGDVDATRRQFHHKEHVVRDQAAP